MAENKTKPTDASVEDYILSRASEQQRTDCHELMALLEKSAVLASAAGNWHRRKGIQGTDAQPSRLS